MHSFLMLNTKENFSLLDRLTGTAFCGNPSGESVLIEFEDAEECERIRAEMSEKSSAFC